MQKLTLVLMCVFMLTALPAPAQDGAEKTENPQQPAPSYQDLRSLYQSRLDLCDLINAQKVLSLTTTPMANLKDDKKQWLTLLEETKNARAKCYQQARNILEQTIAAGMATLEDEEANTPLAAQLELDKQAADMLKIREQISVQLLESMKQDFLDTLEEYNSTWRKKERPAFVKESEKTTNLVRQDMGIVLEMERRNLSLEERLMARTPQSKEDRIKLTRALMAYEDMGGGSSAHLLADLRSEYLYATGHMHEILAIAPNLAPLPEFARQPLLQLANRMQLLELDVEGALRDFRNGTTQKELEGWLSELYQDLSGLSMEVNNLLQRLEIGAPIDASAGDALEIPADIAAFIEDDAEEDEAEDEGKVEGEPAPQEEEKPE